MTWYGKFRGVVADNRDPQGIGRIRATVPDVLGTVTSGWATPCVLASGPLAGVWVLPAVGTGVWIEFEQGDVERPIWVGGWWGSPADVPPSGPGSPPAATDIVIRTTGGATIQLSDEGVVISNGRGASIVLAGPTISCNNGQLTVP